jgi:hypothetical protein
MAAPTQIPIQSNRNQHSGPLGIMHNRALRTTEAAVIYPERRGRAREYIWTAPTYQDRSGKVISMVWCPQCGDWRKREDFHKNRARPNGLQSWCRKHDDTVNERVRAYRERQRALKQSAA